MTTEKEKMTPDKLAEISQKEFLAISEQFDGVDKRFDGVDKRIDGVDKRIDEFRVELKAEIKDVGSAIDSSADRVVGEIKEFMRPHIKSSDSVLIDIERLKEQIK